jgi:hypothetical protein
MEAELQRARKCDSIGIFAGGIAHDFHNLLAIVLGGIGLALMQMSDPEPDVQENMHHATRTALSITEASGQEDKNGL